MAFYAKVRLGRKKDWDWKFPKYCAGNADAWKDLSEQCKQRDNYTCQQCGAKGFKAGGISMLHAAHIISKSSGGEDALYNLKTLCFDCHKEEHPWLRK